MNFPKKAILRLLVFSLSLPLIRAQAAEKPVATIRRMTVLGAGSSVEVEIIANQPLTPEAQVVTGPDRLVIDFPSALPGSELRTLAGTGEMKAVRVASQSNPPVTRVVLDLKSAQPYQIFPSGNTVIVKLSSGAITKIATPTPLREVASDDIPDALPPVKPTSKVEVQFQNGNLSIWANKATLAEVLFEVHKRTGADIPIPAGAEQEQVVAKIGPLPAREAMATLLNGSRFNFIMVGSDRDPFQLRSVILSVRGGAAPQISTYTPQSAPVAQAGPEPMQPEAEEEAAPEVPLPQQPVEGAEEPVPGRDQPDQDNSPR